MKTEDLILIGGGLLAINYVSKGGLGKAVGESVGSLIGGIPEGITVGVIGYSGNVYSPEAENQLTPIGETLRNLDYWLNPLTYLYAENPLHKWGWI